MGLTFDQSAAGIGASAATGSGPGGSAAGIGANAAGAPANDGKKDSSCPTCGGKKKKRSKEDLQKDLQKQREMLLDKKDALERWNAQDRASVREWFGSDDLQTRDTLLARVNGELGLNQQMMQNPDAFFKDGSGNALAYVYGDDPTHQIYLNSTIDNGYDALPLTGDSSRVDVLSHEMSHFSDIGGTADTVYGPSGSLALAAKDPAGAMQNADNLAGFINH